MKNDQSLPKLSVIVPTYKGARFIGETLASILGQTFSDLEVLVIDDASPDNTVDVVSAIKDSRIRLIRNESNLGVAHTRNKAAALARGQYITPHDQDDLSEPTRFEKQIALLEANPTINVVGSWVRTFGDSDEVWQYPVHVEDLKCRFLFGCEIAHTSAVVRASAVPVLSNLYDPDVALCSDYELFSRMSLIGGVANIPEPLVRYRRHKDALSNTASAAMARCARTIHIRLLSQLNLSPTDAELDLHDAIGRSAADYSDRQQLKAIGDWLLKLQSANAAKRLFPARRFRKFLYERWHHTSRNAMRDGAASAGGFLFSKTSWTLGLASPLLDALRL